VAHRTGGALTLTVLGALVFVVPPARAALLAVNDAVVAILTAGQAGAASCSARWRSARARAPPP